MKSRRHNSILFVVFLLLLIPTTIALANSLPPPFQLYLRFFSSASTTPEIQAVQLAGCTDLECATPDYLAEFGICDSEGCYPSKPMIQEDWTFECADSRCLFESGMNEIGTFSPMWKIVVDTGNEAIRTDPVENPDCQFCTIAWKIDLAQPTPAITLDQDFVDPGNVHRNFFTTYGFTIVVEALFTLLFFLVFTKKLAIQLRTLIPAVVLANLLSYPVSWLVIPSFGQFQTNMFRRTAIMVIVAVAIVTTVSLLLRGKGKPIKKGVLIALVAAVPVCAILFLIGLFIASYGNYTVHVAGLSWTVVVILAEIFAVLFETLFIWKFLKGQAKMLWVALLVLLMNALSLLLGLMVF